MPISVLYLDIDNFKHINDRYGHQVGDQLLRLVAKTIKDHIGSVDVTARFGGDEFGILLAETRPEAAALVAGKLKERLEKLAQQNRWPVTFSTGVVTFERIPASVDEMIDAADSQMYLAKQNGKNRTRYQTIVGDKSSLPTAVNL